MRDSEKFASYEDRFPVESNYLSGTDPFLQIERLKPGSNEGFRLHCDGSIFSEVLRTYGSQYRIVDLALRIDETDLKVDFNELPDPQLVARLYIYCPEQTENRAPSFEILGLDCIDRLEDLLLNELPGFCDLTGAFPHLKRARLRPADQPHWLLWKTLTDLHVFGFKGDLEPLGAFPHLTRLVLEDSQLQTLDRIGTIAPKLQTLLIRRHRAALDVSGLSELSELVNLELDIGKASRGLNDLRLRSIQFARIGHLQSADFVENHPGLIWFKTRSYLPKEAPKNIGDNWIKKYGEYGFGGFDVPIAFR